MARYDMAYVLRERRRRADPCCHECHGDGSITYTASGTGETEVACACLFRAGDFSAPDPLADEGNSDARELQRERDNYDGPDDGDAWSGGFAPNH